jgi:hypothetical protein
MPAPQMAGPGAPNGSQLPSAQQQQLGALGIDPSQFQMPFDYAAATQPSTSEKLYRLAAALTGNPAAAAASMAKDRGMQMEANNNALATQRVLGQLGYNAGRLNQGDRKLDQNDVVNLIKQQQANTAATRADIARQALEGRLNPTSRRNLRRPRRVARTRLRTSITRCPRRQSRRTTRA